DDRPARLILNRRPPAEGWAWLKYEDDGQEFEADLGTVQLVALLEG
ncbi:TPA: transcriptional repressor KorB C-terminal beta-barrel domain-containing protein, partial [Pseudomonas aeruginosa]